jgi:hypothetical protein
MSWIPFESVTKVIEKAKAFDWCWTKNSRCKYITVRIDMRDGKCILTDRDDDKITLEQLQHQYGKSNGTD